MRQLWGRWHKVTDNDREASHAALAQAKRQQRHAETLLELTEQIRARNHFADNIHRALGGRTP